MGIGILTAQEGRKISARIAARFHSIPGTPAAIERKTIHAAHRIEEICFPVVATSFIWTEAVADALAGDGVPFIVARSTGDPDGWVHVRRQDEAELVKLAERGVLVHPNG